MHELALCEAIADVVKSHADGQHVDVVRVRIGALRQVVPESLSFCWSMVRDFADMPEAELELESVTAAVQCRSCGHDSEITSQWSLLCPRCDSADVAVLRGNEFLVTSLDVSDREPQQTQKE
ncbi:MAG: hydrogenase maturation nickel metallochaperone HypA [Rhodospirillaceae bacterium]|nr:MAG: hydrogenase maturation nickel metallochaperone HypA [Rhodospirillaceae bacterium]